MSTMLELRGVGKRFGDVTAVDGVDLAIGSGEFFTLLGPSGCGKTTLLRLIAGFERCDRGAILLDGQDLADVPPEKRPLHTVFQSYALFPHLSVERNIGFALEMARVPAAEIRRRVAEALGEVSLAGLGGRMPDELSGGQRQRVAIARALVDRPRLLLLDEPLGALDAKLRAQMKLELMRMQHDVGIGFVYVTHDQAEALALSHRIAVMNRGRVEQLGTPREIYERPASRFVADFIGQCNLLDAVVRRVDGDGLELDVAGLGTTRSPAVPEAAVGTRGALALRPEAVTLAADDGDALPADAVRCRGTVVDSLYEGDVSVLTIALEAGARLRVMQPNADPADGARHAPGAMVVLRWRCAAGHFLAR